MIKKGGICKYIKTGSKIKSHMKRETTKKRKPNQLN